MHSELTHLHSHFRRDLHHRVLAHLRQRQLARGLAAEVSEQTAVFEEGLLDSLALLELVSALESACGAEFDMLLFDPTEVVSVGDLVQQLSLALRR